MGHNPSKAHHTVKTHVYQLSLLVVHCVPPPAATVATRVCVPAAATAPVVPLTVAVSGTSNGAVQLPLLLLTLMELTERVPGAKFRV